MEKITFENSGLESYLHINVLRNCSLSERYEKVESFLVILHKVRIYRSKCYGKKIFRTELLINESHIIL